MTGFITEQPELRTTALKGKSVCNPTSRINDRKKTPEGWQPYVEFVPVVAFGNLAEFISTLSKGTRVRIEGKLQANQFERDGVMVSELQVMAYELDILSRPHHRSDRARDNDNAESGGQAVSGPSGGRRRDDTRYDDDGDRQPESNDNRPVTMLSGGGGWTPEQERRGGKGNGDQRRRGRQVTVRRSRSSVAPDY
ncbi:MAG: single-stranded DNA-binding protein [Pseudomonadota bacterium]